MTLKLTEQVETGSRSRTGWDEFEFVSSMRVDEGMRLSGNVVRAVEDLSRGSSRPLPERRCPLCFAW